MRIFAFGDSHAGKFGADPRFTLCGPPAPTAYGLANEKNRSESLFLLRQMLHEVEQNDIILFSLGEIDCRVHVFRQHVLTGKSYAEVCSDIIARYGRILLAVRNDNPCEIAVLDVPPAVKQGNEYEYDFYGSRNERASIAEEFNSQLEAFCKENAVCFVKLHPHISDEWGWLKEEYAVDDVHVSGEVVPFVVQELQKCFPDI